MGRLSVEISILKLGRAGATARWVSDTSGSVTLTAQRALWASAYPLQPRAAQMVQAAVDPQARLTFFPTLRREGFSFHLCLGSIQNANRPGLLQQPVALASHQSSLFDLSEMTFKYYLENQYS